GAEPLTESTHERISGKARELTEGLGRDPSPLDVAQALFGYVAHRVKNEVRLDGAPQSALACLEKEAGDRPAPSRLLVALLRNRRTPARVVAGLTLAKGPEQQAHYWVEAWINDRWLAMCPVYRLFDRVPSTYLVLAFGDRPLVAARRVKDLKYAFLVDRVGRDEGAA